MSPAIDNLERRKQVRLRVRTDLTVAPQRFEGRTQYVVKDPVRLRYYRFKEKEYFLFQRLDGQRTLEEIQREFERNHRPERMNLESLEAFAQRLLTSGLAHNESPFGDRQILIERRKERRREWFSVLTNLLYIKLPLFNPDRLLDRLMPAFGWLFRPVWATINLGLMAAALMVIGVHFDSFWARLPAYQAFFRLETVFYLWLALGVVKILHEFGHGLCCKVLRGEVHEMGLLILCLSPCLYCNVSDGWKMPSKWQRIWIHSAGIYVELLIAAGAAFLWWNSPAYPFLNHLCLNIMLVCGVSTFVFNANPLLRFDGYYVLGAWMELPNLGEISSRMLMRRILWHALGMELPPEPRRSWELRLFCLAYAALSFFYRWAVTLGFLWIGYQFLKPYKLGSIALSMGGITIGLILGRSLYQSCHSVWQRGRFLEMKPRRVTLSAAVVAAAVLVFFLVPLPVSRVRGPALVQIAPGASENVFVPWTGVLERLYVRDGQRVEAGDLLAEFRNWDLEDQLAQLRSEHDGRQVLVRSLREQTARAVDPIERARLETAWASAEGERRLLLRRIEASAKTIQRLALRAPRSGAVMGAPRSEALGKMWEKDPDTPFCKIGDPSRLTALTPVSPADLRLLRLDGQDGPGLPVTIRVRGSGTQTWTGQVALLPESEAKTVPIQLTSSGGGPLAVTAKSSSKNPIPQSQQYLVDVEFREGDATVCPGTLAEVKIDCRWRSCAWWLWRTLAGTFDLELL